MKKIVTDPIFIKCRKVVESCETTNHCEYTIKYLKLSRRRMQKMFRQNTTVEILFEQMLCEVMTKNWKINYKKQAADFDRWLGYLSHI